VVFFVRGDSSRQGIWLASAPNPGERRRLVSSDANAVAVGDAIVYREGDVLVGQRLDPGMRALTGRPMLVGSGVGAGPQHQLFAAAHDDLLIYGTPSSSLRELRWHDRGGTVSGGVGEPMDAWDVRIAPSGSAVAVTRVDPQLGTLDIWTYEGSRPIPRRISPAIDADDAPAWSRDGQRLAWVSARRSLVLRAALAAAPEETIRKFEHPVRVTDWSPDAQWLVVSESRPVTQSDLWLVPASAQGEPLVYANTAFNEVQGVVSPDGRWIAYASDESGRYEIYLDTLPTPATRARLTNGGGQDPRWRADGGEIFFRRGSEVHAVTPFAADGRPEAMSSTRLFDAGADIRAYDVAADGQRFLLNLPTPDAAPRPLMAIVNIRTLLRFAP
jgi:dipeptidyl aminopeptidase/acylaminoacyl peptidase